MTIRELLHAASPVARDERALLLAHTLGHTKEWLIAHDDANVSPTNQRVFWKLLARRAKGEPFAYLIGEKWFYGRPFKVTKRVLIPRPATEALIEAALGSQGTVVDIGTGSGAIAVTLAAELPEARVIGIDISPAAIRVARTNAKRHHAHVRLLQRDVRRKGFFAGLKPTVIAANLPYIRTGDWKKLDLGVTKHEPRLALTSGKDGLDHYRALMRRIVEAKFSPALVLLEADPWQMTALEKLVRTALPTHRLKRKKDLHGDDRILIAKARA